ncbi:MAG TPA: ABC transporter substrate-binding protein [Kofleriaceae bacterium]|jgi:peptide/nickel transport system substrate-binding protein
MRSAVLAIALAACSPPDHGPRWRAAGNASPRDGGTLRFATSDQVVTLDPAIEYDQISGYIVHALHDTLVGYEPGGTALVPHLAASWRVSPDGLDYTFALRDGIVFADGSPITAESFLAAFARVRAAADSPFQPFLANVASVSAPDPHALAFHLAKADASFVYVLAMPFAAPHRDGSDTTSGPFVLERWDPGVRVVLRKNTRYWDAAHVHLDAIEMAENVPRDVQFLMFERGDLDTVEGLALADYLWIQDQPAWQPFVHVRATLNSYGSRMNVRQKPFDDRRVRQALNYALDKQHSVKLLGGAAIASHGILPPGVLGRDDTLAPYPHDPAKARELLAAAGYPGGFDIEYMIIDDDEAERLAGSLQHDLGEAGVRVHITELSIAMYAAALASKDGPAFAKAGWIADYPDPASFFDGCFHTRAISDEGTTNFAFYSNPELDALLDSARAEPDPARRAALYRRAEHIVYDDAPWLWDYHQETVEVTQPYVRDYEPHPVWLRDYTHAWLDLDGDGERVTR